MTHEELTRKLQREEDAARMVEVARKAGVDRASVFAWRAGLEWPSSTFWTADRIAAYIHTVLATEGEKDDEKM